MAQHSKPKTISKEVQEARFVNPYNFVPLERNCQRLSDIGAQPGSLTGYLDCRLKPLSPLFIPNTTNDKALPAPATFSEDRSKGFPKGARSYDFFSYSDLRGKSAPDILANPSLPVIPGTEIRGTVRSVFEAAFNGCMASVYLERPLGRRSGKPKNAGILRKNKEKNEWEITPCRRWMLNTTFRDEEKAKRHGQYVDSLAYEKWKEGQPLYVKRVDYTKQLKNGQTLQIPLVTEWKETVQAGPEWELGYLHKGEKFGSKKHHEAVFVEIKNSNRICVDKADVKRLEEVLRQYRDINMNIRAKQALKQKLHEGHKISAEQAWYKGYEINEERTLVYYNEDKNNLYLAPACISKEVFSQSIGRLLQQQGGYQPCESRDYVCSACALFGMIPKGPDQSEEVVGKARASRVRFEDATLLKPPKAEQIGRCYLAEMTLPELGEPKPGAVEFYTLPPSEKQPSSAFYKYWTYDYQMEGNRRRPLSEDQPKLRGRKFYWHSDAWKKYVHNQEAPTEMRQMIRPLKPAEGPEEDEDMLFGFRVYFENISEEELNQLCWALTFQDADCAHKIGRAKPLGFGSVQLQVEQIYRRQINRESGEWSLEPWKLKEFPIESTAAIAALKVMTNWQQRPKAEVCYPKGQADSQSVGGKNASASHQWFTANRGTINKPAFAKVLPKPEEEMAGKDPEGRWLYELKKT